MAARRRHGLDKIGGLNESDGRTGAPAEFMRLEGNNMRIGGALGVVLLVCLVAVPTWAQSNKAIRATGRVTAIAADSLTVQSGAATMTFAVDTQTRVEGKGVGTKTRAMKAENKSPAITDFVGEADSVTVDYHDMGGGKLHAAKVSIRVKSFKK